MSRCKASEIPRSEAYEKYVAGTRDKDNAANGRFSSAQKKIPGPMHSSIRGCPFFILKILEGPQSAKAAPPVQAGLLTPSPFQRPSHSKMRTVVRNGWKGSLFKKKKARLQRRVRPRIARGSLLSPSGRLNLLGG